MSLKDKFSDLKGKVTGGSKGFLPDLIDDITTFTVKLDLVNVGIAAAIVASVVYLSSLIFSSKRKKRK